MKQKVLGILLILFSFFAHGQEKQKAFVDTLDNALDVSYYLNNLHGLLPIISPITEPAVGYGAAVAGLYFIPKEETGDKKFKMPDIAGIAGGYTENGTWFTGGGYAGFWRDDRIRYRGVFGYGDIKLKYYGKGGDFLANNPVRFDMNSYFFLQQAIFRIGDSKFLLGGKYQFTKTTVNLLADLNIPGVNPLDFELVNSGLGVIAEYESLNNYFSPSKGLRVNLTYDQYLEVLGSNRDFGRITLFMLDYITLIEGGWNSGFRVELQTSTGKAPFYMLPYVSLRGVPALRYQGELTALVETEQELVLSNRWSLVGFGGYGRAFESFDDMSKGASAWNAGMGFRYLTARLFGLKMGVDVARGPEQWAVYVVFGSSWMK